MASTANYSEKHDLLYEEFAIPACALHWLQSIATGPSAARASEAFWRRVENLEDRRDANLANELTLPAEFTSDQNIVLMHELIEQHVLIHRM